MSYRIIQVNEEFFIQQDADDYEDDTGIVANCSWCTLAKFKGNIYRGPRVFSSVEVAEATLTLIKRKNCNDHVGFIPNQKHSEMKSI